MAHQKAETNRISEERRAITVLLVDDHRFVGAVLERLLATETDIELHCCYSAVDAVALANRINPTIILQDLVLPDIDGIAMVRLFRSNPPTAGTPVIVLSANDDADTRARALAEGASDYLVKLPPKDALVACIRRHAIASGAVDAGEGTVASAHAPGASGPGTNETLDRSVLAQFRQANTAGAPDFTLMLIDRFIKEATSQVEMLKDARQRQDIQALKATAHKLKGSSLTMGAKRLATLCTEMEEHVAGDSGGVITLELMTEVDRELVKVTAALAAEWQGGSQP
jgi:PleD family two-component response regulator